MGLHWSVDIKPTGPGQNQKKKWSCRTREKASDMKSTAWLACTTSHSWLHRTASGGGCTFSSRDGAVRQLCLKPIYNFTSIGRKRRKSWQMLVGYTKTWMHVALFKKKQKNWKHDCCLSLTNGVHLRSSTIPFWVQYAQVLLEVHVFLVLSESDWILHVMHIGLNDPHVTMWFIPRRQST